MTKPFRPMLAALAPENADQLSYPLFASAKLDGIRCVIKDGVALSRSLKPIANEHLQHSLSDPTLEGFDGELIVGEPTHPDVFNRSTSEIRRQQGKPDFTFHVFDFCKNPLLPFDMRLEILEEAVHRAGHPNVVLHPHWRIGSPLHLDEIEQEVLSQGYEGLITRHPTGQYKFGRSTVKQEWMLKIKRFRDDEAMAVGY